MIRAFPSLNRWCSENRKPSFQQPNLLIGNKLRLRCLELSGRSKDLRIAIVLMDALLKLDGLAGFKEALLLLKGLLERFWQTVYPQLDPADDNDPLQRVNIIASISTPIGTFGDPLRILEHLRATPLCSSIQMGRFSLLEILRAEGAPPEPGEKSIATTPQIEAAFRDTNPEELTRTNALLSESITLVQEIDGLLTQVVGSTNAADLTPLSAELISMQRRVAPHVPSETDGSATQAVSVVSGTTQTNSAISGDIRSREDVIKVLNKICDFYAKVEPSSPVPLVLKRAARLVEMDFMQIMKDMSPDGIAQVRMITGEVEGE